MPESRRLRAGTATTVEQVHPTRGTNAGAARDADEAVAALVATLQNGWEEHDAAITDSMLADDVLWGSPYGETLQGYEPLHEIHVELKQRGAGGQSSRFEVVQVLVPAPDVVLAHVRRLALEETDRSFSEMALYVLVRRDGDWWLAAGQNTPIRPKPV